MKRAGFYRKKSKAKLHKSATVYVLISSTLSAHLLLAELDAAPDKDWLEGKAASQGNIFSLTEWQRGTQRRRFTGVQAALQAER